MNNATTQLTESTQSIFNGTKNSAIYLIVVTTMALFLNSALPGQVGSPKFLKTAPAVGESIPAVNLFYADGETFDTTQLKGHYSVVVFGCLT